MAENNGPEPPVSGWFFILAAAILAGAGWLVLAMDDGPPHGVGVALLVVGSLLAAIGSVSVGVESGVRRARP